jgi:hypothetical protein
VSMKLNEPEAWREIARRIAEKGCVRYGLCAEADSLWHSARISIYTVLDMEERIGEHVFGYEGNWAYKPGTEPEARILAALWLALEAEEDAA